MKLLLKITIAFILIFSASYQLYFYISPSVTVKNESSHIITAANIKLPKSNLNFGSIERGQMNTIYYELSQSDGSYQYSLRLADKTITGNCANLTNNEINKRFVITLDKRNFVSCRF